MTDTLPTTEPTGWRTKRPVREAARLRPVWDTAFRDPVREGHLRLGGLGATERQLAKFGLVTLGLLLASVLFTDVWRSGELLSLNSPGRLAFLPVGLLPVTLVAFLVAWSLVTWGALVASPLVRVVVAVVFLLTNATLAVPMPFDIGGGAALSYGPDLVRVGYFVVAGALVLSAALVPLRRTSTRMLPVLRVVTVLGLLLFFMTHLWIHVALVGEGIEGGAQLFLAGSIQETDGLLLPLVYVSGVLVIDFSLDVAVGASLAARDLPLRAARWALVALLATKLWIEVGHRWADWTTYVADRPDAVARTVVSVVLLGVTVALVTRYPATEAFEAAKERLLYGSAAAYTLGVVIGLLVVGVGVFAVAQLGLRELPGFIDAFPTLELTQYGNIVLSALALVVGVVLLRRRRTDMQVEVGSGLVVLGVWGLPAFVLATAGVELGFSDPLVDVLVTVGVAVVLAWRWRRLDAAGVIALGAIVIFSWLVMSRGDWISVAGSLFGLPAILVVVVGIVFSLAADAGFTTTSSRRLPQGSRVLLYVGYLVLSVTILHWVEASHSDSIAADAANAGFYYLGIPWAAWLLGRRLLRPPAE